jgi:uncharacterized protein
MKRRLWIDVLTPKQVLFFSPLVEEARARGWEVLATSRHYREIPPLAKLYGVDFEYVGERGGEDPVEQLEASTKRQQELIPKVAEFGPSVALSVASGVCARISYGLRVPHVAVNDSPHSIVAGRLSLPFSVKLLTPWIIPYSAWSRFGVQQRQIARYRALDPAAWLKRKGPRGYVPALGGGKTIVVRLEESFAPYMAGTDKNWNWRVLDAVADAFEDCNLVALCRYPEQLRAVKAHYGSKYVVPEGTVDGRSLLERTDVFVGMGGTMTAEAALMGVPALSSFQGRLYTEKYLLSVGLLVKAGGTASVKRGVTSLLKESARRRSAERAARVLAGMEDPVPFILGHLEKLAA